MKYNRIEVFARRTLVVFRAYDNEGAYDEITQFPGPILRDLPGKYFTHTCMDAGSFLHMSRVDDNTVTLFFTWMYGNYAYTQMEKIAFDELKSVCDEAINQLSDDDNW